MKAKIEYGDDYEEEELFYLISFFLYTNIYKYLPTSQRP